MTLTDRLKAHPPEAIAYSFQHYRPERREQITWGELYREARLRGADCGQVVLLFYAPGLEFIRAFYGALLCGAVPVAVQSSNPAHRLRCTRELELASRAVGSSIVWTSSELADRVPPSYQVRRTDLADSEAAECPGETAYLQLTSGTTHTPRAVRLTHRQALWMARQIAIEGEADARSIGVCWLPLFHDMGMFTHILEPLVTGGRSHGMAPLDFLQQPRRWLEAIAELGATHTAAPNFAYQHCLDRAVPPVDLSTLRRAYNGGEPVRQETLDGFRARFGVRPTPCYGLAEAGLLVSGAAPGRAPVLDGYVSCGPVLGGTEVAIADEEISVRSPATEGWVKTGDLGFLRDGEIYVTGRRKDVIVLHGVNHSPTRFEQVAEKATGCPAVAFGVPGPFGEELVLVVESAETEATRRLIGRVFEATGCSPSAVVLVGPRQLLRTTSGKIQRGRCRERYLDDRK